jgi:16S rRNA (guanine966-N2)-methyltransferase
MSMRIIGGALRGRRLRGRPSAATRPTSDRVREAIASALQARGRLNGARVLDLFAGTGALGLEALSWGAEVLLAADSDRKAVSCIRENVRALGLEARVRTLELDLQRTPAKVAAAIERAGLAPFSLVFVDPPYALVPAAVDLLAALAERQLLAVGAIAVVEHARKSPPERPARFAELAAYRYGDTGVALWETIAEPADS